MEKQSKLSILIVEDHHEMLQILGKFLSEQGFHIENADCGENALQQYEEKQPDLMLLDVMLPGISGIEVTRRIRSNGMHDKYVPIIMLTAKSEVKDVVAGLSVGADDYIVKPFQFEELLARIESVLRVKVLNEKYQDQSRELEAANQQIYQLSQTLMEKNKELRKKIYELHNIFDVSFELHSILDSNRLINSTLLYLIGQFACKSALFLFTWKKNEQRLSVLNSKGFYQADVDTLTIEKSDRLVKYLKEVNDPVLLNKIPKTYINTPAYKEFHKLNITLLFLIKIHENEDALICLGPRVKQDIFHTNELEIMTIIRHIVSIALSNASLYDEVKQLSYTDGMTELHNYRYFEMRLKEEVLRHARNQQDVSLIILDVDYFKNYNDTLGHPAGDKVLRQLAIILKETVRENDIVARYGGEEFSIIVPGLSGKGINTLANRIREAVEQYKFPNESIQPLGKVTISVGSASLPSDASDTTDLIRKADTALYAAKHKGRNCVIHYSDDLV
jgi:diguanylate cyclase (GGDEF)-like protein